MRVPPDQSTTLGRAARPAPRRDPWLRSERVTLVSRVPNRKVWTRLRASVTAWRKCRNSRVYSLIEPEMSSSATTAAARSSAPQILEIDQRAAAPCSRAWCGACRCVAGRSGARRRVVHLVERQHQAARSPPWPRRSRRRSSARSPSAAAPRWSDTVRRASISISRTSAAACRQAGEQRLLARAARRLRRLGCGAGACGSIMP